MTVVINGRDGLTVDDAMRQVLDTFELLERANPSQSLPMVWRLVSASTNSPLTVVAEATPVHSGMNVDGAAREQKLAFRHCLSELAQGRVPAAWNAPEARKRAKSFFARTHNGIAATDIMLDAGEPPLTLTARDAQIAEPILDQLPITGKPRVQVGSIEGFLISVETYYHKPAIRIRERRSGAEVLCVVPEEFRLQVASEAGFEDVWRERRVIMHGQLHYRADGQIEKVLATHVRALPSRVVDPSEIRDSEFTEGLSSEEYLERFREGDFG